MRPIRYLHELGERRRAVALLMAEGFTDQAIANQLEVTPATVRKHRWLLAKQIGVTCEQDGRVIIVRWVLGHRAA